MIILGKSVSQTLLTVVIVWCQRFSFYKWFPAVMIGYVLCSQFGLPGQFPTYAFLPLLLGPVIDVGNTAFVVWAFQKLGFRFLHPERRDPIWHAVPNAVARLEPWLTSKRIHRKRGWTRVQV